MGYRAGGAGMGEHKGPGFWSVERKERDNKTNQISNLITISTCSGKQWSYSHRDADYRMCRPRPRAHTDTSITVRGRPY